MKKLGKLEINPDKIMNNEELITLRGGYDEQGIWMGCTCSGGANPPYSDSWEKCYDGASSAASDVEKKCLDGGTCNNLNQWCLT